VVLVVPLWSLIVTRSGSNQLLSCPAAAGDAAAEHDCREPWGHTLTLNSAFMLFSYSGFSATPLVQTPSAMVSTVPPEDCRARAPLNAATCVLSAASWAAGPPAAAANPLLPATTFHISL
jgi:hypothetical protein